MHRHKLAVRSSSGLHHPLATLDRSSAPAVVPEHHRREKVMRRLACALAAAVLIAVGAGAAQSNGSVSLGGSNRFVRIITNPYLPYRPGSLWVYKGVKDGASQTDVVRVTHRARMIDGVRCTTITEIATHGTRVLERTTDWYAQDRAGNVWYFGENTAAYGPGGQVDRPGSWLAGD